MRQRRKARSSTGLQESYLSRSLFFVRRLREGKFLELAERVKQLDCRRLDWSRRAGIGISEEAWARAERVGASACQMFCHPEVITADPTLIAYYRGAAGVPQKGMTHLCFGTANLEAGKGQLPPERAQQLATTLNRIISSILEHEEGFTLADAILLMNATAGSAIQGSWANMVGKGAAAALKEMIANYFLEDSLVQAEIGPAGNLRPIGQSGLSEAAIGFQTTNGYQFIFGSEPDIRVVSPENQLVGVIEVKGGMDPAGARERYGAAKKSFDAALTANKTALTMYVAACITETVQADIEADRLVRTVFNLTRLLAEPAARAEFLRELRWWCRLMNRASFPAV